jgi:transcriptional regulator with XRE-family HTH domain
MLDVLRGAHMKPLISVGANIYRLRKELHLTQDDLALFLGVTKASVSKWETGQSYPDIELLPKIATYFDVTVDSLIGYEPQMSKAGIARECARLRAAFASEPFEEVHAQCQALIRDYYSCYPLLMQVVTLYINHANFVEGDARKALFEESIDICRRVRRNSSSSADIKMAEAVEASVLLAMGNPQDAIDVLSDTVEIDVGADLLLANAYGALGQVNEADKVLQSALFQSLAADASRLAQLAMLRAADREKLETVHQRALALIKAFDLESVFLNCAAVHLTFAMAYLMSGDTSSAFDCLEDYERACRKLEFPLQLHGDDFFDKLETWMEEASVTGTSLPRDEALLKKSLVEGVSANPAFAPLADDTRFKCIVANLEEIAR